MAYKIVHLSRHILYPLLNNGSHRTRMDNESRSEPAEYPSTTPQNWLPETFTLLCFPFRMEQIGTVFEMFYVLIIV